MSEQVVIEVIEAPPVTVEVVEEAGVLVVEIDRPTAVEVVEVLVPGPQGPQGPPGAPYLHQLQDVDATARTDGSFLYFDASRAKFVADDIETKIKLTDGGNF